MIRFYILPIETIKNNRGPKYFNFMPGPPDPTKLSIPFSLKDYGLIDAALIAADITQAQHEQLVAKPDVGATPLDIDQNISDIAIPKVIAVMEQLRIPADWVDNTYTYRQILRMIGGLFMFAQRYHGMHNAQLIGNVAQLDSRWNRIPQARRTKILETADSLGYEYGNIQNSWKVRRMLKYLGDKWGNTPLHFGFITL